ncbi:Aluminum-activated malate transporter [Corchorus capsularis]|uniref:Aluminum-activated malate transporter n=1 Tax=Corchorus capsularis TaxID=210143 RepID=A0A1R3GX48_COCAP|nr:Aluminum-activated malate transporter [Corchorus capsularis]
MGLASETQKTEGWESIKALLGKMRTKVTEFPGKIKKLGQDDPRRIVHSLKVGLAITLVSLFYYFDPLYVGFGSSAMWAVLTVVVVFEFSVGATLGKGLNRGLATFLAGSLGFGAHHLATLPGEKFQPILLGFFVFLLATTVSFIRFFPRMKARYDYGLVIFILTFCLISVSGYRDEEVLELAHKRVSTILIGGFTALFVCIFICPVWAGDDLHNLAANNIEKLANFLEEFGDEYFKESKDRESNKASLQGYKSVLNSKQNEESLVNFARWEPRHGRFRFRHPWKQYQKIGSLTRHCAYRVEALNGYLNSDVKASLETRGKIKEACMKLSCESGKALKELASALRTMTQPPSQCPHIAKSKNAANSLKSLLKTGLCKDIDLQEIVAVATVASLLLDVLSCTERISESVHEIASLARFKSLEDDKVADGAKINQKGQVNNKPCSNSIEQPNHHVITID